MSKKDLWLWALFSFFGLLIVLSIAASVERVFANPIH